MIVSMMPYLLFTEDCRQAIALYQQVFGAEVEGLVTYGDSGMALSGMNASQVVNATLKLNGHALGVADTMLGQTLIKPEKTQQSIWLEVSDEATIQGMYQQLVEAKATVVTALEPSLWQSNYGKVQDPFGVTWELNQQY